jgi:hypothetical protein
VAPGQPEPALRSHAEAKLADPRRDVLHPERVRNRGVARYGEVTPTVVAEHQVGTQIADYALVTD